MSESEWEAMELFWSDPPPPAINTLQMFFLKQVYILAILREWNFSDTQWLILQANNIFAYILKYTQSLPSKE